MTLEEALISVLPPLPGIGKRWHVVAEDLRRVEIEPRPELIEPYTILPMLKDLESRGKVMVTPAPLYAGDGTNGGYSFNRTG
jgi:hypothetical protein